MRGESPTGHFRHRSEVGSGQQHVYRFPQSLDPERPIGSHGPELLYTETCPSPIDLRPVWGQHSGRYLTFFSCCSRALCPRPVPGRRCSRRTQYRVMCGEPARPLHRAGHGPQVRPGDRRGRRRSRSRTGEAGRRPGWTSPACGSRSGPGQPSGRSHRPSET